MLSSGVTELRSHDVGDGRSSHCTVRFLVAAEAAPGMLPRLLQPFARRDLTPDRVTCQRTGEMLQVEIAVDAVPAEMIHLIEGNLLQVVGVHRVSRIAMRAAA